MDPLLEQFLQEARENLAFIDQNLESISEGEDELLNSIFRAAHTLKGGSGIVGFDSIKQITHVAEDMLDLIRSKKIALTPTMVDALYDAFDEVVNLVEAAEESGGIVTADEAVIKNIIDALKNGLQQEEPAFESPIRLLDNVDSIVNLDLHFLRDELQIKLNFLDTKIDELFCREAKLYAVFFDIDETSLVYGNDPIYALSLMKEKVLGFDVCMSDENSKTVLTGIEDEEGLLLKSQIIAFLYCSYEEIEDNLFHYMSELKFLPLDIATLLSISKGEHYHQIDFLKELVHICDTKNNEVIRKQIEKSLELVGKETLQYHQLERFLDISGLIKESDIFQLNSFFANLYRGEVYSCNELATEEFRGETIFGAVNQDDYNVKEEKEETVVVQPNEGLAEINKDIFNQQYRLVNLFEDESSLQRVRVVLENFRDLIPDFPKSLQNKQEIVAFLEQQLGMTSVVTEQQDEQIEENCNMSQEPVLEKIVEFIEQEEPEPMISFEGNEDKELILEPVIRNNQNDIQKPHANKTVKIEESAIDTLMNLVGELLVVKNSLPYLADNIVTMAQEKIKREIMEKYIFINRLSEQLQDLIMNIRMLPISYVFDRNPKLVRDISKQLGKKVKLEMYGGDTKLDKNMIEMLANPLMHIMRNSLDHGIEEPLKREQKGKEPVGTIKISAYTQSDKIIIEVIDDGAGVDLKKLANRVLEKGLMSFEEIDKLSEEQLANLICTPGLSTVDDVSDLSGRGVGMDVVKKSVESFGGSIFIHTKANQGTKVVLSIPSSLAVSSLLHIKMNGINYGIPMASVSETVKINKSQIEYLHNEQFIYLREEVVPLLFIKSMFKAENNELLSVVVLNIKDNLLAVGVNELLGQLDVVQKPLVGIMQNHPLFSGNALLGNGEIIMIIDPIGFLGLAQKLKDETLVA